MAAAPALVWSRHSAEAGGALDSAVRRRGNRESVGEHRGFTFFREGVLASLDNPPSYLQVNPQIPAAILADELINQRIQLFVGMRR